MMIRSNPIIIVTHVGNSFAQADAGKLTASAAAAPVASTTGASGGLAGSDADPAELTAFVSGRGA